MDFFDDFRIIYNEFKRNITDVCLKHLIQQKEEDLHKALIRLENEDAAFDQHDDDEVRGEWYRGRTRRDQVRRIKRLRRDISAVIFTGSLYEQH